MPRPKSILQRIEMDVAQRAHNCQHSKGHRILRGERRLKVRKDRSWEHYCVKCAQGILARDIENLKDLASGFQDEQ